nr:family 10 glycosylhydrolase [Gemmatimonadaceae bacterium]
MRTHACAAVVAALLGTGCASLVTRPVPDDLPPVPRREFRGLWVTTVGNTDWPSVPGLDAEAHRAELRVVFDRAAALGFNAVVLQVRSAGDAIYPSGLEPWARVLTGRQGQDPGWDPLAFAVAEAHARGLELHAWFNPFRAGRVADSALLAPTHLWRARPDLARLAHGQLWFDPGEPEVRAHALRVIADVVTRYDIDGVHLDDYFYPYPTSAERPVGFPDDASYARWLAGGGTPMARGDWRRQNVDRFVEALFAEVRRVRPTVKVGISPFGIWRPGHPPGVKGLDAYADIYADARQWLARGWVDYFAPQLYWPIASPGQPFVPLLAWWQGVNTSRVHLWPGLPGYRVGDGTATGLPASEIGAQID